MASLTNREFFPVGALRRGNDRAIFTVKLGGVCEILSRGRWDRDGIDVRRVGTAGPGNRDRIVARVEMAMRQLKKKKTRLRFCLAS
jgi:hypothetical protein